MRPTFGRTLWWLFALFIIYGGTSPFRFVTSRAAVIRKMSRLTINPLISPDTGRRVSIPDVVQNVLLFIPFGALGIWAGGATPHAAARRVTFVTALAASLAIGVECLQLLTRGRTAAVSDVVADTAGAFVGAIAARAAWDPSHRWLQRLSSAGVISVRTFYPVMVGTIVLGVAAWVPFDVTLDVGTISGKVHRLRADMWRIGAPNDHAVALIQYALFGFAACAWGESMGRRPAPGFAALIGLAVSCVLASSQILIVSRTPNLASVALCFAAVGGGAFLWIAGRGRSLAMFGIPVLACATAAAQMMALLAPSARTILEGIRHGVDLALLYFALGFCFAQVLERTRATVAGLAIGLLVWSTIGYLLRGQVGHSLDAPALAASALGAWLGAWAGTRGASMFGEFLATLQRPLC